MKKSSCNNIKDGQNRKQLNICCTKGVNRSRGFCEPCPAVSSLCVVNKMNNGWVKIHRKILEKGFYQKSAYVHLWLHLLLTANHEPKEFMWNGNIILIKEGQMITGRKELSRQTKIPESTIEDILKFLEIQHQIQQQKTTKYRLITIVNWIKHQSNNKKSNNRATTEQQQADTNKNDKNVKNDKKKIAETSSAPFSLKEEIKKLEDNPRRDMNIIALYFDERKPDFRSREQFSEALRRHLRAAKALSPFQDDQIIGAIPKAKKITSEWTIDTLVKVLTK